MESKNERKHVCLSDAVWLIFLYSTYNQNRCQRSISVSGTLRTLRLAEKAETAWEPKAAHTWPSLKSKRRKTQKCAIKVFLEDAHVY